jgi:hypothetical protein
MNNQKLAYELIKNRCGTHSLGLVYNFLLKTGHDPNEAEAEFLRYVSGQLPERFLQTARLWVAEEQEGATLREACPDARELVPA